MKRFLVILFSVLSLVVSAQIEGLRIMDMPTFLGNPNGFFIPIASQGLNRKFDLNKLYNKIDSIAPNGSNIDIYRNGTKIYSVPAGLTQTALTTQLASYLLKNDTTKFLPINRIASSSNLGSIKISGNKGILVDPITGEAYSGLSLLSAQSVPYIGSNGAVLEDATGFNYNGTNLSAGHNSAATLSGITLNGNKASLLANNTGLNVTIGTGAGDDDFTKAFNVLNRGNLYLSMFTTGTLGVPASFLRYALFNTHIAPKYKDSSDLGSEDLRFKSLHVRDLFVNGVNINFPNVSGNLGLSVNGIPFDENGNVQIPVGGGGTGSTSVSGTANRIVATTDGSGYILNISPTYTGQGSINTLGTISTGTWNASKIADAYITSAGTWNAHIVNTVNPHNVTIAQLGFGNINNTSDRNKPISIADSIALRGKIGTNATVAGSPLVDNNFEVTTSGITHDGDIGLLKGNGLKVVTAIGDLDYVTPEGQTAAIAKALAAVPSLEIRRAATGVKISTFINEHTIRQKNIFGAGIATVTSTDTTLTINVPTQAAQQKFDTATIYQQLALKANINIGNTFSARQGFGTAPSSSYQLNVLGSSGDLLHLVTTSTSGASVKMESPMPTTANVRLADVAASATNKTASAKIGYYSDAAFVDGSSYPTGIRMFTTPSNSTAPVERLRIGADGKISNTGLPAPDNVMVDLSNQGTVKGGIRFPRMTQAERLAMAPPIGTIVDQIDGGQGLQGLYQWTNSADPGWVHWYSSYNPPPGASGVIPIYTLQGQSTAITPTANNNYYIGDTYGVNTTAGVNLIAIPKTGTLLYIQFKSSVVTGTTGTGELYTFKVKINNTETTLGTRTLNTTRETRYLFDNLNIAVTKDQGIELHIIAPASTSTTKFPTQARMSYVATFQ